MGAISYPIEGTWNGVQAMFNKKQETTQKQTRTVQGHDAVEESTAEERDACVEKFKVMCQTTQDRQKRYTQMAVAASQKHEEEVESRESMISKPST